MNNNSKTSFYLIAPCGIDCENCSIRLAPFDDYAAKEMIEWCLSQGWINQNEGIKEIIEKGLYCVGCRNREGKQWDPECPIYHCCVEEKKLEFCSDCSDFICLNLKRWGKQLKSHGEAIEKLKKMRLR